MQSINQTQTIINSSKKNNNIKGIGAGATTKELHKEYNTLSEYLQETVNINVTATDLFNILNYHKKPFDYEIYYYETNLKIALVNPNDNTHKLFNEYLDFLKYCYNKYIIPTINNHHITALKIYLKKYYNNLFSDKIHQTPINNYLDLLYCIDERNPLNFTALDHIIIKWLSFECYRSI